MSLAARQPERNLHRVNAARSVLPVVALVFLLVTGCSKRVKIDNPTRPTALSLSTSLDPIALDVRIRGRVDGSATFATTRGFRQTVSGEFKIIAQRGDWYERTYVIHYFPSNVTVGHITVTYDFEHLQ